MWLTHVNILNPFSRQNYIQYTFFLVEHLLTDKKHCTLWVPFLWYFFFTAGSPYMDIIESDFGLPAFACTLIMQWYIAPYTDVCVAVVTSTVSFGHIFWPNWALEAIQANLVVERLWGSIFLRVCGTPFNDRISVSR